MHFVARFLLCLCLGLTLVLTFAGAAKAASFIKIEKMSGPDLTAILLYGQIQAGDMDELLSIQSANNTRSMVLFLESPGGDAREGLLIAKLVHNQKWGTAVINKAHCFSACATIWIAGEHKFLSSDALVGFHDVYSDSGPSAPGNAIVGAFYGQLGLSDRAIQYLTSAPPDKLNFVDLSIAAEIGLSVVDYDKLADIPTTPAPVQNTNTSDNSITETPLAPPAQNPSPAPGPIASSFTSLDQVDIIGHDIMVAASGTDDAEGCRRLCESRNDCVAYTFDARHQMCYPKNGGNLKLFNKNAISGVRQEILSSLRMSTISLRSKSRIIGNEYKTLKSTMIGSCVEACDLDLSCKALTYNSATNMCWLFKDFPSPTRTPGWLVGIKN